MVCSGGGGTTTRYEPVWQGMARETSEKLLVLLFFINTWITRRRKGEQMSKKLEDLYTSDSLHEGLWGNLKRFGSEVKKRASVQAFPERPPEPKAAPKKIEPNLGQKNVQADAKEPEFGLGRAMVGGAIGSVLTAGNPLGALAGSVLAQKEPLKLFKRWKSKL